MLRSLSISELNALKSELNGFKNSSIFEIVGDENNLGIGFSQNDEQRWLWVDFAGPKSLALWLERRPRMSKKAKNERKPIHLFLHSNFKGLIFGGSMLDAKKGRNLFLFFQGVEGELEKGSRRVHFGVEVENTSPIKASIELRLFAQGKNVIAKIGKKSLSWRKVKELPEAPKGGLEIQPIKKQRLKEIEEIWRQELQKQHEMRQEKGRSKVGESPTQTTKKKSFESMAKQSLRKKTHAIKKMQEEIEESQKVDWSKTAEWLQLQNSNFLARLESCSNPEILDRDKSWQENMQTCYEKSKKVRSKNLIRKERIEGLQNEVNELEKYLQALETNDREFATKLEREIFSTNAIGVSKKPSKTFDSNFLNKAKAKGRTLNLEDGRKAYLGKSAEDNLKILRAARPHDLWLHLADKPSAHAIIQKNKNEKLATEIVEKTALWLADQTDPKILSEMGSVSIVSSEVRYVTPIKGDKIGRVTYRQESKMIFRVKD